MALNTLKKYPGAKILYNLICSRSVPELIAKAGGIPIRSKVGHSIIKAMMREQDIVFGGEHSGHFYFRDNWYADSGMIALMQCLELFSEAGKTGQRGHRTDRHPLSLGRDQQPRQGHSGKAARD